MHEAAHRCGRSRASVRICCPSRLRVRRQLIDRAAFGGGGEPGARVFGDAGLRPLFERGDEGILGEVFGQADVAGEADEAGDERADSMRQTASMARFDR